MVTEAKIQWTEIKPASTSGKVTKLRKNKKPREAFQATLSNRNPNQVV